MEGWTLWFCLLTTRFLHTRNCNAILSMLRSEETVTLAGVLRSLTILFSLLIAQRAMGMWTKDLDRALKTSNK